MGLHFKSRERIFTPKNIRIFAQKKARKRTRMPLMPWHFSNLRNIYFVYYLSSMSCKLVTTHPQHSYQNATQYRPMAGNLNQIPLGPLDMEKTGHNTNLKQNLKCGQFYPPFFLSFQTDQFRQAHQLDGLEGTDVSSRESPDAVPLLGFFNFFFFSSCFPIQSLSRDFTQ